MKFIQGFYVQAHPDLLDLAYGGDGPQVIVRRGLGNYMYAGTLYQNDLGVWHGEMLDPQGESRIYDVSVDFDEISFKKQYLRHRQNPDHYIIYHFIRQSNNTWSGTWQWPNREQDGSGVSRCVITDIDESLFADDVRAFLKSQPQEDRRKQTGNSE